MKKAVFAVLCFLLILSGCNVYTEEYFEQSVRDAYDEGHRAGYDEGHDDGYCYGYEEGYRQGYNEAEKCYSGNYSDGYYDGYNDALYGLPNCYETDWDEYWEKYCQVFDPETGELIEDAG